MKPSVLLRKVARKAGAAPANLAALTFAAPFVRERLERQRIAALASMRSPAPHLCEADRKIVEDLRTDGVHITSLDALGVPSSNVMLKGCMELAEKYRRLRLQGGLEGKDAFQASSEDLLSRRAIFDWGLNARVLDIVETYLRHPAAYDGLNLFYTKSDGRQVAARKWHRDVEDRRVLKIVVYATEVDDDDGPFQLLRARVPRAESDNAAFFPVFTQEGFEDRLGRPLDDSIVTTCRGPAGTVVFAETALNYHRGKPATKRDRCAIFYNYFARWPLRPYFCDRGTLSRHQLRQLMQTLDERQRDCVSWRQSLPAFLRLVPTAPI